MPIGKKTRNIFIVAQWTNPRMYWWYIRGFFLEILYLYFRFFLKIVNNKIEEISSVDKSAETQENASCNPKLHML